MVSIRATCARAEKNRVQRPVFGPESRKTAYPPTLKKVRKIGGLAKIRSCTKKSPNVILHRSGVLLFSRLLIPPPPLRAWCLGSPRAIPAPGGTDRPGRSLKIWPCTPAVWDQPPYVERDPKWLPQLHPHENPQRKFQHALRTRILNLPGRTQGTPRPCRSAGQCERARLIRAPPEFPGVVIFAASPLGFFRHSSPCPRWGAGFNPTRAQDQAAAGSHCPRPCRFPKPSLLRCPSPP